MPAFSYHCLAMDGTPRDGVLTAGSLDGARQQLAEKGWKILQLKSAGADGASTVRTAPSAGSPLAAPAPAPARVSTSATPAETASAPLARGAVRFTYQALDSAGRPRDGVLLAVSQEEARAQLEARGLKILLLKSGEPGSVTTTAAPATSAPPPARRAQATPGVPPGAGSEPSPRLSLRQLNLLFIQLNTMIAAGMSYVRALHALSQSDDLAAASVAHIVGDKINAGLSLSKAMASMPVTFDSFVVRIIKVGETTGNMHGVIELLTVSLTREEKQRNRVLGALAYPSFVLTACGAMVAFLLYYMLPGYLSIFKQTGARVPFVTQALISFSQSPLPLVAVGLPLLGLGLLVATSARLSFSRRALEYLKYHTPRLQVWFRKALLIRVCRHLALMLRTGISLTESLQILGHPSTGFGPMDRALHDTRERVTSGSNLADAMAESAEVFPRFLTQAVSAGEQIGKIPAFLDKWADMMDEELEHTIDTFIQMLEPLMLLVMGLVVGFIVMAAFLPVFTILQTLS